MKKIVVIFLIWCALFFVWIVSTPSPSLQCIQKTDSIVVLTGGKKRIQEGLRLLEIGCGQRLLISGVHPKVRPSQLSLPSTWKDSVTLGYAALDTQGNALETAQWIKKHKIRSLRLVTGAYHMRRSLLEFQKALQDVVIIPHPVRDPHPSFWFLIHEYHKYVWSLMRPSAITIAGKKGNGDVL